jgi:hypothetical protein
MFNIKEYQKEYFKKYYKQNKDKIKERSKKYRVEHQDWKKNYDKQYYLKNKDKIREYRKQWGKNNKDWLNLYFKKRREENPIYRMEVNCRARIKIFLRKGLTAKDNKTLTLVGCDWNSLKKHIEQKFRKGMNWDNYGKWHIDHIKPLYIAKTEDDVKNLCHYSNLQPLWAEENLRKNKY